MKGTIKTISPDKGYGFIRANDGNEYFFHSSAMVNPLDFSRIRKHQEVEFEPSESPKGLRALEVTLSQS